MKLGIFNGLLLAAAILGFAGWLRSLPGFVPAAPRTVAVHYRPIALPRIEGARLAGAWSVTADDDRFGGISGGSWHDGRLLAVSDSGVVIRLDLPGTSAPRASIMDLPVVPGPANRKIGRDSEAIARDPKGRGWWVAFEQRHSLLLYDERFTRLIDRRALHSASFRKNRGVEALYAGGPDRLVALPEASGASDAVRLEDGRLVLLERRIGLRGLTSRLVVDGRSIGLPLGRLDNPEAIAAAPLADGGTRLWIMTDNDFRAARPTLLIAIDLPRAARQAGRP